MLLPRAKPFLFSHCILTAPNVNAGLWPSPFTWEPETSGDYHFPEISLWSTPGCALRPMTPAHKWGVRCWSARGPDDSERCALASQLLESFLCPLEEGAQTNTKYIWLLLSTLHLEAWMLLDYLSFCLNVLASEIGFQLATYLTNCVGNWMSWTVSDCGAVCKAHSGLQVEETLRRTVLGPFVHSPY